jgi:hypothetical protein
LTGEVEAGALAMSVRMSRRSLLKSSLGAAVLVAAPEYLFPKAGRAAATRAGASSHFFLYGILDPIADSAPTIQAGRPDTAGPPSTIANELAAPPVRSADRTRLALVMLGQRGAVAAVKVSVVDAATAAEISSGTLTLPGLPDALIIANATFAGASSVVGVVLSVTTPKSRRMFPKLDPLTGNTRMVESVTWVSRHVLAYFNSPTGKFAGPFDLADAPSLAHVNLAANDKDLFLWTLAEPAAVMGTKENPLPAPVPQLSVFPLGSGKPRLKIDASPVWPVNEEPLATLSNGALARLVYGRHVETYAPDTGQHTTVTLDPLAKDIARPARTTMQLRSDGLAFFANPGLGVAAIADSARGFSVLSTVSSAPGVAPAGGPQSKAVLSADAKTVYTVGTAAGAGLSAYDVGSGRLQAATTSREYVAVYGLSSGGLLAIANDNPRLSFFDPALNRLGTADTNLNVVEVY